MTSRTHSYNTARNWSQWLSIAVAATVFVCGLLWQSISLVGGGAAVLCIVLRQFGAATTVHEPRRRGERVDPRAKNEDYATAEQPRVLDQLQTSASPHSTDALVDELLATRRYALLLRPETKQHLSQLHIVRAIRQLDESMALVPAGRVLLGQLAEQSHAACGPADTDQKLVERNLVNVEPVYFDRFCVTNEEYQRFVDAGGYEQLEFWHEEALPALLDFVDQTGAPGPALLVRRPVLRHRGSLPGRRHQLV